MTPSARAQAAIDILEQVIASARDDGPPADQLVSRYFKTRRYAGSGDRRAVRELVFQAIRSSDRPESGRSALLAVAGAAALFDGSPHGPALVEPGEVQAEQRFIPQWIEPLLSAHVTSDEWPALAERAPLDVRVNAARADRGSLVDQFEGAEPTRLSPWGLRLPIDQRVDDHPAYASGLIEVQDEGSQLIALACASKAGERLLDLCAGAGGKALALAAAAPGATILASDTNRDRLSKLGPRAERAGAAIETRLLNPPREVEELADWTNRADMVLVDAPCSGSGTWRRNPEGRWRLTPQRLDRLEAVQAQLLDIAAGQVAPGGRLIYAVCSLLSREGAGQIAAFRTRHSSWISETVPIEGGREDGGGRLLTPAHDGTDGFFVACLRRPC
ncbi:MAG: RsmB/NOP family class I SAM-dependent RNA methyltransferase [Sphingomicrobium sp.]